MFLAAEEDEAEVLLTMLILREMSSMRPERVTSPEDAKDEAEAVDSSVESPPPEPPGTSNDF